jgi:hypothetical protein
MFLASYDFDGDPGVLVPGYERMLAQYPPESLELHVCVIREGGITVYDACPSKAEFEDFSSSGQFREAVRAAGLPAPRTTGRGEVHRAFMKETASR